MCVGPGHVFPGRHAQLVRVHIDFRDFGRNNNRNNVIIGETMSVSVRVYGIIYWDLS